LTSKVKVRHVFIAEFDGTWEESASFGGIFRRNRRRDFLFGMHIRNIQRILIFGM
jgi:hypothetical protein